MTIAEGVLAATMLVNTIGGGANPEINSSHGKALEGSLRDRIVNIQSLDANTLDDLLAKTVGENLDGGVHIKGEEIPKLEDGNYDFWKVAKVEMRLNPETGKMQYYNTLKPGQDGYVQGLDEGSGSAPYTVDGYDFVKEVQYGESGVSVYEYRTIESIPKLSNGNYEFWSIAKLKIEIDPVTGKSKFVNSLKPGQRGYVYGLTETSVPPYRVVGYDYVTSENTGAGVTLNEYLPSESND